MLQIACGIFLGLYTYDFSKKMSLKIKDYFSKRKGGNKKL